MPRKKTKKARFFSSKLIYKAKRGHIHDDSKPRYDCYIPAESGSYGIFDCWVCDSKGNIHPGYNVSPVPVSADNLGDVVGEVKSEE